VDPLLPRDAPPETEEALEACLSHPSPELAADMAALDGDILVLGAGGKMGPSLARLAVRAGKRVVAVARFTSPGLRAALARDGVETVSADLMDEAGLRALPDLPNVVFMAGQKFGTTGNEAQTWAMNAYLPGRVAERFRGSRIVAFSTGNVYPLTAVAHGGADEGLPPGPVGEYAQSCLGRERAFEHFSRRHGTPGALIRLNYAVELRYGVLLEVARAVREGRPVDLRTGHVNVIWQGDANTMALRALRLCASPPVVLNVTGPETVSVRWLAARFGERFGVPVRLTGAEADTALLSNAACAFGLFGYPRMPLARLIDWTAHWLERGGPTLERPTHFQEREGRF